MQIQTAAPGSNAARPPRRDIITPHPDGDRNIRRAMKAALQVLNEQRKMEYAAPGKSRCRIVAAAGSREVEVLATSWDRAVGTRVPAARRNRDNTVDAAVGYETVRAIAHGEFERIDIVAHEDGSLSVNGASGTTRYHPVPGIESRSIQATLQTPSKSAIVATLTRTRALKLLRGMRTERRRWTIFRFEAGAAGLRARPVDAKTGEAGTPAEAALIGAAGRAPRPDIAFGLYVAHLIDTLRTMSGKLVHLHVENPSRPVHVISEDGSQHFALATKRL